MVFTIDYKDSIIHQYDAMKFSFFAFKIFPENWKNVDGRDIHLQETYTIPESQPNSYYSFLLHPYFCNLEPTQNQIFTLVSVEITYPKSVYFKSGTGGGCKRFKIMRKISEQEWYSGAFNVETLRDLLYLSKNPRILQKGFFVDYKFLCQWAIICNNQNILLFLLNNKLIVVEQCLIDLAKLNENQSIVGIFEQYA